MQQMDFTNIGKISSSPAAFYFKTNIALYFI